MKRSGIIPLLALVVVAPLSAQQQAGATAEQVVLKAYQTLDDANQKKDRATIEKMTADDFMYIHSNGLIHNRAQEVAENTSSDIAWTSRKSEELKVRVYGDVAIITGKLSLAGTAKELASGARLFTLVWVKRNGQWQTVSGQATLVPTK